MTLELLIGVSGIIIALGAAITTIWQGFLTRQHNRLSVKPILRIDRNSTLKYFNIVLLNNGVGPAIIKSVKYFVNNMEILGNNIPKQVIEKLELSGWYEHFELLTGESFSCGEQRSLFKSIGVIEGDTAMTAFKPFTIEIKYESIYNEEFIIKDEDNR